ncbi:MAG: hypothetical protein ACTSVV_13400 [Promethearchaeota archaeon]
MSIVKIRNKKALEQLQAKLNLRIGRRIAQQEILDYCVFLANKNFDEFVELITNIPKLTDDKVKEIIRRRNKLKDIPYNPDAKFRNSEDQDIYNI